MQAKKALHALRGLVKLQALVRGHQVRKQIAATLRRMHAVMAIQVRARFQRIQMAEEPQFAVKSQSSRYGRFPQEMGFKRAQSKYLFLYLKVLRITVSLYECIKIHAPSYQITCLFSFNFHNFLTNQTLTIRAIKSTTFCLTRKASKKQTYGAPKFNNNHCYVLF